MHQYDTTVTTVSHRPFETTLNFVWPHKDEIYLPICALLRLLESTILNFDVRCPTFQIIAQLENFVACLALTLTKRINRPPWSASRILYINLSPRHSSKSARECGPCLLRFSVHFKGTIPHDSCALLPKNLPISSMSGCRDLQSALHPIEPCTSFLSDFTFCFKL